MTAGGLIVCGARIGFDIPERFSAELLQAFAHTSIVETSDEPTMWYRFVGNQQAGSFVREDPVRSTDAVDLGESLSDLVDDMHLSVALHATEHVFVHAGVVSWNGRAIVIPGRSHSGKSSLVHALVERGATYMSDEYALVTEAGAIAPYARPIQLRTQTGRALVDAHTIGDVGVAPIEPSLVLFTKYKTDAAFEPVPVPPASAALELFDNTVVAEVQPRAATEAVARVARKAPAVRTLRPDATHVALDILELEEQLREAP